MYTALIINNYQFFCKFTNAYLKSKPGMEGIVWKTGRHTEYFGQTNEQSLQEVVFMYMIAR